MARSQYVESPRSSRRRRNPPPAPEVDWARAQDQLEDSPPRRSRTDRNSDDNRRERDRDWVRDRYREIQQDDEEIIMRTPDSRASSSSLRPFHSEPRGRRSTPSHSISSSKTSMRVHHPPMSSMTRPSTSKELYRRPSISFREAAASGGVYEDDESPPETRRSQSRPRSVHPVSSAPVSRHTSGTFATPYVSESETDGEDTETTYDSPDEEREPRRAERERLRSRTERSRSRIERSRSRVEPRRPHHWRRRDEVLARPEEDYDEIDSRHTPSIGEEPPSRAISRSRSRSRAPAGRITQELQGSMSDEPSVEDLRDRFEPRENRKHRHKSHGREPRRRRSDSYADPSPTPKRYVLPSIFGGNNPGSSHRVRSSSKRYYDTEVVSMDKPDRHHPPSASLRRANTVSGSQVAASQHHSVSSTKRSSSSTFLGNFFGPSLHSHHHQAPDKPAKK